jgi:GTP-binding protein HflX
MRGPGETQIETDRRIIKQKIAHLKEKLTVIDRQMATQRGNRGALVRMALIGYTNVGKSTLMNALSKSEVLAENKLFATLDTTVRKVVVGNLPFLLTDTVGFIRKLPTQLVESFKSTLDEVREADILLHVVDVAHPNYEDHMESVASILQELGCQDTPQIVVFNKIDAWTAPTDDEGRPAGTLDELKSAWARRTNGQCVFISALHKDQFDALREKIYRNAATIHAARFPFDTFLY